MSAHGNLSRERQGLRSCRAQAYDVGLEKRPQQGPEAEPLVRGSGGEALLKLKALKHFVRLNELNRRPKLCCLYANRHKYESGQQFKAADSQFFSLQRAQVAPLPMPMGAHVFYNTSQQK